MLPVTYPEGSPEIRLEGIEIDQKQWKKLLFEGSKGKIITQQPRGLEGSFSYELLLFETYLMIWE